MRGDKNKLTNFYRALDQLASLPIDPNPQVESNELAVLILDRNRSRARIGIEQCKNGLYRYTYRRGHNMQLIEQEIIDLDKFFCPPHGMILRIALYQDRQVLKKW